MEQRQAAHALKQELEFQKQQTALHGMRTLHSQHDAISLLHSRDQQKKEERVHEVAKHVGVNAATAMMFGP